MWLSLTGQQWFDSTGRAMRMGLDSRVSRSDLHCPCLISILPINLLENDVGKTLVIGDTHAPFMHPDALPFLAAVNKKHNPNRVIHIGDVGDFHALSRFVRNPAGHSAGEELDRAIEQLSPLYNQFPSVKVCRGNHDERLAKRAEESGIPRKFLRPLQELLKMPKGWVWDDQWEFDGVVYEHGDPFQGEKAHVRAAEANMAPTVIGHIHSYAGIAYVANRRHLIWGFNVGCLIDSKAYAFEYAKKFKAKPIVGCGLVIGHVPMFIPMNLDKNGRWNGELP